MLAVALFFFFFFTYGSILGFACGLSMVEDFGMMMSKESRFEPEIRLVCDFGH